MVPVVETAGYRDRRDSRAIFRSLLPEPSCPVVILLVQQLRQSDSTFASLYTRLDSAPELFLIVEDKSGEGTNDFVWGGNPGEGQEDVDRVTQRYGTLPFTAYARISRGSDSDKPECLLVQAFVHLRGLANGGERRKSAGDPMFSLQFFHVNKCGGHR